MARDFFISLYLSVFSIIFNIFKIFPQKKKTVFVASFGDNILFTLKELERQAEDQVVILKTSQCKTDFGSERLTLDFETANILDWFRSVYHLATSRKVIVDNYFAFLAVTNFSANVKCVQLWHAAGAIKQFALKDPSVENRTAAAYKRFRRVYNRFDHVAVGSERMAAIFRESFEINNDRILRSGIPRTDFFFDDAKIKQAKKLVVTEYPAMHGKKVILYAPTYRDDELNVSELHLNIDKMYRAFKGEYILMLRLHPAVNGSFQNKYPGFVVNVSSYANINHLLVTTDILITDYSSIPFEFALLNRPMIFFAYDQEVYAKSRGFWEDYEVLVPGPVVKTTRQVIDIICNGKYDLERIQRFAETWNQYSNGKSSEKLVHSLYREHANVKSVVKAQS
ncbi:CDP-glycerol glycerophosphotransferase family protein [Virgibacillus siamensis]|uniref:CDP-glycerol glycerophosphotransferase family protein n=1 Tax=Virgibacillus siamensis TaxID=480071 RepID=UPI0009863CDB|nr:CDP-glycerol glycerophosphotransferase family protein [Virgibacillus siamensis]